MSQLDTLSQWERTVSRYMPHLSRPQAYVLAFWSYGMGADEIVWNDQCSGLTRQITRHLLLDDAPALA